MTTDDSNIYDFPDRETKMVNDPGTISNLRRLRLKAELDIDDLSNLTGILEQRLRQIEADKVEPTATEVKAIAMVLDTRFSGTLPLSTESAPLDPLMLERLKCISHIWQIDDLEDLRQIQAFLSIHVAP